MNVVNIIFFQSAEIALQSSAYVFLPFPKHATEAESTQRTPWRCNDDDFQLAVRPQPLRYVSSFHIILSTDSSFNAEHVRDGISGDQTHSSRTPHSGLRGQTMRGRTTDDPELIVKVTKNVITMNDMGEDDTVSHTKSEAQWGKASDMA